MKGRVALAVVLAAAVTTTLAPSAALKAAAPAAIDTSSRPTTSSTLPTVEMPTAEALLALLDEWRELNRWVPGVVVGLRVGTDTPVVVASGNNAQTGAPLDARAPFAIASITKTFVGALALQLVDEGRLRLDGTVASYGIDFPNSDRITVGQLLTHTSGLPDWDTEALQQLIIANLDRTFVADEILLWVAGRPLVFEPGTGVQYSNTNTILLGRVIEAVTGTGLTTSLHERILDPLGLTHTFYEATEDGPRPTPGLFSLDDGATILNTADFPTRGLLSALGAAGGMVSNVDDLLAWSEGFLRAGTLGHADLADSRFAVTPNGLGLGVIVWSPTVGGCVFWRGRRGCPDGTNVVAVMGDGSVPGTNSIVAYFPAWDLTIVALDNSALVEVDYYLVHQLLVELLGHPVSGLREGARASVGS